MICQRCMDTLDCYQYQPLYEFTPIVDYQWGFGTVKVPWKGDAMSKEKVIVTADLGEHWEQAARFMQEKVQAFVAKNPDVGLLRMIEWWHTQAVAAKADALAMMDIYGPKD